MLWGFFSIRMGACIIFPDAGGKEGPEGNKLGSGSRMLGLADFGNRLGVLGLKIILFWGFKVKSCFSFSVSRWFWTVEFRPKFIFLNRGGRSDVGFSGFGTWPSRLKLRGGWLSEGRFQPCFPLLFCSDLRSWFPCWFFCCSRRKRSLVRLASGVRRRTSTVQPAAAPGCTGAAAP